MAALSPRALTAALAGLLALGGCSAYDDGYGYGGVSLGYGSGYYDPWYYGRYGWYDGFYYPGSGYFIYDRHGQRHRWNNHHRRYWESRRHNQEGRHEWRDRDHDRDGRAERPREWRGDRNSHPGFRHEERRTDSGRTRRWDRQRENWSSSGRSRPDAGATQPSYRNEHRTLGPARKGFSEGGVSPREWKRKD